MAKININLDSLKTRREWRRHKVKDGSNVFRILPPFGEASNGYPYRKWQIIWGLQDPESGRMRPFASSMTSEKRCPVMEYVQELKKKAENLKSQLAASGLSEEEQKKSLAPLNKLIQDISPKTVFIYNAVDKSGDVGLLEVKSTAHKKLKQLMIEYVQEYNQDPTSLNSEETDSGVWFNIIRTGTMRDTEYDVKKVQNKIKNAYGRVTFEDDRSPLPDSVVQNYADMAYDLSSVYQIKTYEQLKEILDANMPNLIESCPDADPESGVTVSTPPIASSKPVTAQAKPTGSKPVTLKFDPDEEFDDVGTVNSTTRPTVKAQAVADDDFLAEADALLNS